MKGFAYDPGRIVRYAVHSATHKFPYYWLVPKDVEDNLRMREEMLLAASEDPELAEELYAMCRDDFLFFVNAFVFTYDPRRPDATRIPFITWKIQDEFARRMLDWAGKCDAFMDKSRDMGMSWCWLAFATWLFLFGNDATSQMFISRKEDYVDSTENLDALLPRIDFILEGLPSFLKPRAGILRQNMLFFNPANGATIIGEATTGDVGRGGRKTIIWLDEFSMFDVQRMGMGAEAWTATQAATDCRIVGGTPRGRDNAHYDLFCKAHRGEMQYFRMAWWDHPVKAEGLYVDNGKKRSPWYDRQVKERFRTAVEAAQELDIDYLHSSQQYFDKDVQDRAVLTCIQPLLIGELMLDEECKPARFEANRAGRLKLWCTLVDGAPPLGRYVIGADIAFGTGSSNSVISVGNADTGQQVAEFVSPTIEPQDLASVAHAMGWWFRSGLDPALIVWEHHGPGLLFAGRLIRPPAKGVEYATSGSGLGYRNLYYRSQKKDELNTGQGLRYGWINSPDTNRVMLGDINRSIRTGAITVTSRECADELSEYIFNGSGEVQHRRQANKLDDSGAGKNHGDRVRALGLWLTGIMQVPRRRYDSPEQVSGNTMHGRSVRKKLEARRSRPKWWSGEKPSWQ